MKKHFCLVLIISLFTSCYSQNKFPELTGSYLGQKPPGETAELFLDGIISTTSEAEMCAAFTRDGREFYFNSYKSGYWNIYYTKEINGKWINPEPLSFSANFTDRDFTISPDGNKIVFGSDRPTNGDLGPQEKLSIFITERSKNNRWSKPIQISSAINSERGENYPSLASNGNLYFFSNRPEGFGGCDIYVSKFANGSYIKAVNIGPEVNSDKHDWDSYIAPDESYIIFSSLNRDDTIGGQDLYISFKKGQNEWTKAVNMGSCVNSSSSEICPSVTLDGKYLFFTSRRRGKADIYWVDFSVIEKLRSKN